VYFGSSALFPIFLCNYLGTKLYMACARGEQSSKFFIHYLAYMAGMLMQNPFHQMMLFLQAELGPTPGKRRY